jgi:hypothetical protein
MTLKKFFIFSLVQWLVFTFLKIWLFGHLVLSNAGLQNILFWVLTGIVFIVIAKGFGIISYFEAIFLVVVWLLVDLLLDLILTSIFTGLGIFINRAFGPDI